MADDFDVVRRGVASVMQFKAPNISDTVYDDAVAASWIWDSSSFFHRIKTSGAGPLVIQLNSLSADDSEFSHSIYFGYWNGGSGDEVEFQPDTLDSINTGGAGVSFSLVSTGNIIVFALISYKKKWHIGTFSPASGQEVGLAAGTGITIGGAYPDFTVTNSAPDQVVALTSGGGCTITGSYPNFTISVP